MEKIKIFCDESNFTGPNLLSPEQPVFTYATVCVEDDEADQLVAEFFNNISYQKSRKEIKSNIILSRPNGKEAGLQLLQKMKNNIKVSVIHKEFALACKFVETIFEPVIKNMNVYMYQTGLHLYIAHLLLGMHNSGENILRSFLNAVRNEDAFAFLQENKNDTLLGAFIKTHTHTIEEEIKLLKSDKWSLDMTLTCLHTLLTLWYDEKRRPIEVFYDPSKPIADNMGIISAFIKRGDHEPLKYRLLGKDVSLSYDLYSVQELNSQDSSGIMLADLASGFLKIGEVTDDINFYKHAVIPGTKEFIKTPADEAFLMAQFICLVELSKELIKYGPKYWYDFSYEYTAQQHGIRAAKAVLKKHMDNIRNYIDVVSKGKLQ